MNKVRELLEEHLRTILVALIAVIIIVLASVIYSVAVGETGKRVLYISEVTGGASVIKGDGQIAASRNMTVSSGDVIVTNSEGTVKLKTDNGKFIYVEPSSTVYVDYTEQKEKGSVIVNVSDGSVLCRLDGKLKKNTIFEVRTPNSIISAQGTVFHVDFSYYENYYSYQGVMLTRVNAIESMLNLQLYNVNGEKSGEPQLLGEGLGAELMSCSGFNGYQYLNEQVSLTEFTPATLRLLIRMSGERNLPLELTELNDAFNAVYGRTETQTEALITVPTASRSETSAEETTAPFGALPENSDTDRSVIVSPVFTEEQAVGFDTSASDTAPFYETEITTSAPSDTTLTETTTSVTTTTVTTTSVTTTSVTTTTAPPVTTTKASLTAAPVTTAPVTTAAAVTTTAPKTVYVPPVTTAPVKTTTKAPQTAAPATTAATAAATTTAPPTETEAPETTPDTRNWWEIINSNNTNYSEEVRDNSKRQES